ncbi:two-component sensor histidine kinase [Moritella sp. 28]|nr:two-component sensor histidine kinase [Moritella sp. 28]
MFTNLNRIINRNMAHTLFFKLYISITAVIIGSIVFVTMLINYYDDTDTGFVHDVSFTAVLLDDFVEDTDRWNISVELLNKVIGFTIKKMTAKQAFDYQLQHELLYEINLNEESDTPLLPAGIGKVGVYLHTEEENDLLAAVLPHNDGFLLIIDNPEMIYSKGYSEDWEDSGPELFLLGFIFSSIALVLYSSVKNISDHVYRLSTASLALADGQLDTRVDDKIPAPLNQMAASFNEMAISLQYSQHQQQVMANAIAHELRTPLTRIQLVMGLLSNEEHSSYTAELHSDLSRYSVEMEALANDILMLQTIENKPSSAHQIVDLSELMQSREIEFQRQYSHVSLFSDIDTVRVDANARYLQLIVDNLVKNACLYADSTVKLSLKNDPEYFSIVVEDDGEGISPLQREQVLDAFTRLDNSRSRQTGGFGLGLAIVNTIVKTMKAEINIGTSELGGAMFVVKFKHSN